jgi:acetyltransferase-like isoleucine patch superfamily enzyme
MSGSKSPLVTIITPSFNQGQFIERTIKSVLAQTYQNIEYIVLDAMSTDCTAEVLDRYKSRISIIRREADKGQSDAIVKGFQMAKGVLVGWINSDDILYPECVERIVEAHLRNSAAVLLHCSTIDFISEDDKHIGSVKVPLINREHLLRKDNTLVQPGSFYLRSALAEVGYFDSTLRYSMDLDLWLRLLRVGSAVDVHDGPVAAYREWSGTKTVTGGEKLARERLKLLDLHGGSRSDPAQRKILLALRKAIILERMVVFSDPLFSIISFLRLALYYGLLIHLPASSGKYTRWTRAIRRSICSPLFKACGDNINIEKGARFGTGKRVSLGENSGIGVNCQIMGTVSIGNNVMMGPEVMMITSTHASSRTDIPMLQQQFSPERPIFIEDDVWIGARCVVLPGVRISKGVIVGAGSVVTKSIPPFVVVAGNPARQIKSRL